MNGFNGWTLACPACKNTLTVVAAEDSLCCPRCEEVFSRTNGIWCFLSADRKKYFAAFLRDYTRIRMAEGRGSGSADYYLRLPECPSGHPVAWQWALRRRTFDCFRRRVLPRLGANLQVLDLGAGVGWLSHRLSELGHHPCAIDLSDDEQDGLGAARWYPQQWPRIRAEFDRLPLARAAADLVIYNASLHYSPDYRATLREGLRVLRPAGTIVVLETPIYRCEASGRQMLAERHTDFERRYGTRSDHLPSQGFLTWRNLDALADELGLRWTCHTPWYGWRWALRPWAARLKNRREPSRFTILMLHRS